MDSRRRPRLSLDLLRGFRVAARHLSVFIVVAPGAAEREPVAAFVSWLRRQMNEDEGPTAAPPRAAKRPSRPRADG
jgi:hypothetical protein